MSTRTILYVVAAVALLAIAATVNSIGSNSFISINATGGKAQMVYGWPFVMCGVMSHTPPNGGPDIRDFRFKTILFAQPWPSLASYIAIFPATFNLAWWCVCGGLVFSLVGRRQWESGSRLPRFSLAHLILLQGLIAAAIAGHYSFR